MEPVKPANQGDALKPASGNNAGAGFESYRRLLAQIPQTELPAVPAALQPGYEPRVVLRRDFLAQELFKNRNPIRLRWYRAASLAAALVLVAGAVTFALNNTQDRLKAAVVYAGGNVVVMQPAEARSAAGALWPGEDLNSGSILSAGAIIMTGPDSAADIALADGVVLRLKENTRLKVERMSQKRDGGRDFQIFVEYGRLLAVAEGLHRMDEFRVVTPDAFAEVRQTAFRISADDRGTIVHILRGGMEIRSRAVDGLPAIVESNQVAQVQATDIRPLLTTAPGSLYMDTRDSYELSRRITNLPSGSLAALGVGSDQNDESNVQATPPAGSKMTSQLNMKDGSSIRGQIVGQIGQRVLVESGSENMSLSVSDIQGIEYFPGDAGTNSLY